TNDTTHFIRMMSPDAGGTDQITQNRGYVAIPEVGDQVMVNFVHNHPDRPFVMGGMFHGGIGLGGGMSNRVKSIQTRSGHRVVFTEDESIIITDKSGNEIHLDTKGSNINITAPETITIQCKNFNINVTENMNTTVGINKSNNVGMNITETAGANIWQNASLNYNLNATNIMNMASENFTYDATDIHKNASEGIEVAAAKDYIQNSEQTIHNLSGEKGHNA
ncbi:phage baseplate assembly protein V, partial [Chryseobacterium sp. PBS4-4]